MTLDTMFEVNDMPLAAISGPEEGRGRSIISAGEGLFKFSPNYFFLFFFVFLLKNTFRKERVEAERVSSRVYLAVLYVLLHLMSQRVT